jgi:CheY-like chemotaxis protein
VLEERRFAARLLLRAEIRWNDVVSVGHTSELTADRIVVRAARTFPAGVQVELNLSFPRLIEPLTITGEVIATHDPLSHERSAGMTISVPSGPSRDRLAAVLERIGRPAEPRKPLSYRILVADDSGLMRDMLAYGAKRHFKPLGGLVTVDLAADGEEAWRMLGDGAYDLAIVDYYMPVMTGSELVERVRKTEAIADLPVVIISIGGKDVRAASFAAGADLFLDKPLALTDLFRTLEQLTGREQRP